MTIKAPKAGEWAVDPQGNCFIVTKTTKSRKTGEVALWDGDKKYRQGQWSYLETVEITEEDMNLPLNDSEIATIIAMMQSMVDTQDFTDKDVLKLLLLDQKSQVWNATPFELKKSFTECVQNHLASVAA